MNDYEFEVGDKVTFNPYGVPFPMVVLKRTDTNMWGVKDERRYYYLGMQISDKLMAVSSATTVTTGKSIEESVLYDKEMSLGDKKRSRMAAKQATFCDRYGSNIPLFKLRDKGEKTVRPVSIDLSKIEQRMLAFYLDRDKEI